MAIKTRKKQPKEKQLPVGLGKHETVIKFEESFKWPGTRAQVTFDGPEFQEWIYSTLPMIRDIKPMHYTVAVTEGIKIGKFVFYMREVPMWEWGSRWGELLGDLAHVLLPDSEPVPIRCALPLYRGTQEAYCAFSTTVYIPVLASPAKYKPKWLDPWMSLTPNEVTTQRGQIRRAKGDTAMAGLGLGWAARRVLERDKVTHLTVYEKSREVLEYFGKPLLAEFPGKLTLVCTSAYVVNWLKHDVALWDIWETWGEAAWDNKFLAIRKQMQNAGKVCVGWGGSSIRG